MHHQEKFHQKVSHQRMHHQEMLHQIARILMVRSDAVGDIGLCYGKTGVALFLYLYSRYSGNPEAASTADDLIDQVMEGIHPNTPTDYAHGLTGFGASVVFLSRSGFLEGDTDEVLEPLDTLLHELLSRHAPPIGYAGIGKYLSSRLSRADHAPHRETDERNRKSLEILLDLPRNRYGSYTEALWAVDFFTHALHSGIDRHKISAFLQEAIAQIEENIQEDIRFGNYPDTFNPLGFSVLLVRAAQYSNDTAYTDKARSLLHLYEAGFQRYLDNDSSGMISGSFKWGVLYRFLGEHLHQDAFLRLSDEWLRRSLEKGGLFSDPYEGMPVGVMDGYAGMGLALLALTGGCGWEWLELLPVYQERAKVLLEATN